MSDSWSDALSTRERYSEWRRGRDSNPGQRFCPCNRLAGGCLRPTRPPLQGSSPPSIRLPRAGVRSWWPARSGDRNVMFCGDVAALHRSSHAEVDDMRDAATDCFPVTELFSRPADPRRAHCERPADGFRGGAEGARSAPGQSSASISSAGSAILDHIRLVVHKDGVLHRLPARGHASDLAFEHTDPWPVRGRCHPYWIRVTREDGAQAWTSPVYLDA